jgi:RHS repeat-associated protein
MKKIYLLFILFIWAFIAVAQSEALKMTSVPPSPNAAQLGKYGEIPINLSTGAPSYNIPIYTIAEGDLNWSVALNYNYTGFKPSEGPSWVGRGWTLSAGGVITRTTQGIRDESVNGYFSKGSMVATSLNERENNLPLTIAIHEDASKGTLDGEPDMFHFNFGGYSGKFFYGADGQPHIVSNRKIKIERLDANSTIEDGNHTPDHLIVKWTLTTEDGTIYIFDVREYTVSSYLLTTTYDAPSTWHLSEIISPSGRKLKFYYTALGETKSIQTAFVEKGVSPNCPNPSDIEGCIQGSATFSNEEGVRYNTSEERFLTKIESSSGYNQLLFNSEIVSTFIEDKTSTSRRLTGIDIKNKYSTELISSYEFKFDDVDKYALMTYGEVSKTGERKPPFKFSYIRERIANVIPGYTKALDYWGYYNAAYNNSLIPQKGANRVPSFDEASIGALSKITYPTGGVTKFEYEQNEYSFTSGGLVTGQQVVSELHQYTIKSTLGIGNVAFTVPDEAQYFIEYQCVKDPTNPNPNPNCNCPSLWTNNKKYVYPTAKLQPNVTYNTSNFISNSVIPEVTCYDDLIIVAKVTVYRPVGTNKKFGPGIRVKKTISAESATSTTPVVKEYFYNSISDPTRSSGGLNREPLFAGLATFPIGSPPALQSYNFYRTENIVTIGSPYVIYEDVEERTNGTNKIIYNYSSYRALYNDINTYPYNQSFDPIGTTENYDFTRGLLLSKKIYKGITNTIVSQTDYSYLFQKDGGPGATLGGYKSPSFFYEFLVKAPDAMSGGNVNVGFGKFYLTASGWLKKTGETTIVKDMDGNNPMTTTINYTYEPSNPRHFQVVQTSTTKSDGASTEIINKYPLDYESVSPKQSFITDMIANNVVNPIIEQQKWVNRGAVRTLVGTTLNYFKSLDVNTLQGYTSGNTNLFPKAKIIVPDKQYTFFSNQPIDETTANTKLFTGYTFDNSIYREKLRFENFDARNNLRQQIHLDSDNTAYLWGYKGIFLIAEIKNCTTSALETALTSIGSSIAEIYDLENEATIQTKMLALRGALPGSLVTSYTYLPLIGVASETDPSGNKTRYVYDAFNRLKEIYNTNDKLVKSYKYEYTKGDGVIVDKPETPIFIGSTNICNGYGTTLVVSNCDGRVVWDDDSFIGDIRELNPSATTTYTAYCLSEENVPSDIATVTITVSYVNIPAPVISASATTICTSGTVTLSATGCNSGTVVWSNGESGVTIQISPTVTGTYTAACKIDDCKSGASNSLIITVVAIPQAPAIASNKLFLQNAEEATLTASGCSGTVLWSNGMSGSSINVTIATTGTFSATCKESICTSPPSNTVTIFNCDNLREFKPLIGAFNTSYPNNCTTVFSSLSNPCPNYTEALWHIEKPNRDLILETYNGSYINLSETSVIKVVCVPLVNGMRDPISCLSKLSDPLTINVINNIPGPTITANRTINYNHLLLRDEVKLCTGESVTLTATGCAGSYKWIESGNTYDGSSLTITTNISDPAATKIYNLICTSDGCNSINKQIGVNINKKPVISSVTSSATLNACSTLNLTATVTNQDGIYWQGPNGFSGTTQNVSINNINGANQGKYTIYAYTSSGCAASSIVNITVSETKPVLTTQSDITNLCNGQTATLLASGCDAGIIKWYDSETATTPVSTEANFYITPALVATDNLRLIPYFATCTLDGCESSKSSIILEVSNVVVAPTLTSSVSSINCGGVVQITAQCTRTEERVKWSNGDISSSYFESKYLEPTTTTTYTAKCVNFGGLCESNSGSVTVTITQLPVLTISGDANRTICSNKPITLTISNTCIGTIVWSDGTNTYVKAELEVSTAGTYTATCQNEVCTSAPSSPVVVSVNTGLEFTASYNAPVLAGANLELKTSLTTPNSYTYSWAGPNDFTSTVAEPTITNAQKALHKGTYTVTVTNPTGGCTSTATINVVINETDCECESCGTDGKKILTQNPLVNPVLQNTSGTPLTGNNFVVENIYLKPTESIPTKPFEIAQSITYLDGLGRPIQKTNLKAGGNGEDIIAGIEYDDFGREEKKYLPFAKANTNGLLLTNFVTDQRNYFDTDPNKSADKMVAYAQTVFEASPASRPTEQGAPGQTWQIGQNHTVKFDYRANTFADGIKIISYDYATKKIIVGKKPFSTVDLNYGSGELIVSKVTDENGRNAYEYKDKEGKSICKDVEGTKTYYIYDDFSRLVYVLQPMAVDKLLTNLPSNPSVPVEIDVRNETDYKNFLFTYEYDARGRMTSKQVPGSAVVTMTYNNRDELTQSVDANGNTSYSTYDDMGRLEAVQLKPVGQSTAFEISRTFYDTYADTYPSGTDLSYKPTHTNYLPVLAQTISNPIGRGTVVKTAILNENQTVEKYIYAATYFDILGRSIQTQATNHKDNTVDITSSELDFVGKVTSTKLSTQGHTIDQHSSYDAGGRVIAVCQKTDDYDYWEPISRNHYNSIGELAYKQVGCDNKGQKIDYGHNVRGWLLNINDPDNLVTDKDLFGLKLSYQDASNNPLYNGNISQLKYSTGQHDAAVTANYTVKQGDNYLYKFTYDNLDRLLTGKLDKKKAGTSSFLPYFELTGMQYDLNGNIKTLNRSLRINETDASLTVVDQLAYNYEANTTNRLKGVKDNNSSTMYFNDKNGTDTDYLYDLAGNITKDDNKDIGSIKYNHSNLPYEISVAGVNGGTIKYWYGAAGQKVKKIVDYTDTNKPDKITDYVAGLVFENNGLEFIPTAEGRAVLKTSIYKNPDGNNVTPPTSGGEYLYEYSLKDHLGNLKVACRCGDPKRDEAGLIITGTEPLRNVQENHYDPWGMSLGTPPDQKQANLNNRYQYNGKEIVEDFDIALYEYGFRWYDSQIARFSSVDPLANDYVYKTSYDYSENRPIDGFDLDGLEYMQYLKKIEYTGGMIDYVSAVDNGAINVINIVPDLWNSGVSNYKSLVNRSWTRDISNELSTMGSNIKNWAKNEYNYTITTPIGKQLVDAGKVLISPQTVEMAATIAIGSKIPTPTLTPVVNGINARISLARNFLKKSGVSEIERHMEAIYFESSVFTEVKPEGSVFYRYSLKGTTEPKHYFFEEEYTMPGEVGKHSMYANPDKYVKEKFTLTKPVKVLNTRVRLGNEPSSSRQIFSTEIEKASKIEKIDVD